MRAPNILSCRKTTAIGGETNSNGMSLVIGVKIRSSPSWAGRWYTYGNTRTRSRFQIGSSSCGNQDVVRNTPEVPGPQRVTCEILEGVHGAREGPECPYPGRWQLLHPQHD